MVGKKIELQVKEAKPKGTASVPNTEVKNSAVSSMVKARAPGERLMDTAPPGTYKATFIRGGPFEGNYVINGSHYVLDTLLCALYTIISCNLHKVPLFPVCGQTG